MRLLITLLLLLTFTLTGCNTEPAQPPTITGPSVGGIPVFPGAQEVTAPPLVLRSVEQSHGISLRDLDRGAFTTPQTPSEVINFYAEEMSRLQWRYIDEIAPGNGLIIRRFLKDGHRAIIAIIHEDNQTYLLLLDGLQ